MTVEMLALIGGMVLLALLGLLAVVNQRSDNELSGFTVVVGLVFVVGAVLLFSRAGI